MVTSTMIAGRKKVMQGDVLHEPCLKTLFGFCVVQREDQAFPAVKPGVERVLITVRKPISYI